MPCLHVLCVSCMFCMCYMSHTHLAPSPLFPPPSRQVSPLKPGEMAGGSFCANMQGLEHYRRFGYKGKTALATHLQEQEQEKKEGQVPAAAAATATTATSLLLQDMQQDPAWQEIRYKCNRGILHDGDMPHLSTPITVRNRPTVRHVLCAVCCVLCAVCCVLWAVCCVLWAVCCGLTSPRPLTAPSSTSCPTSGESSSASTVSLRKWARAAFEPQSTRYATHCMSPACLLHVYCCIAIACGAKP